MLNLESEFALGGSYIITDLAFLYLVYSYREYRLIFISLR